MRALSYLGAAALSLSSLILADQSCSGSVTSSGSRKIALVIDESGSMFDTDPDDLRVAAGKAIVQALLPSDRVTVIAFDDDFRIISPLGAPSTASFAGIEPKGGTYIAQGVDAAINETTKDPANTAHETGIIVLTDGEDSLVEDLVDQLNRAASLGIRVSFGFLNPDAAYDTQDPDVLAAILGTNGIYSTIDTDKAQAQFVNLVLTHGLADVDNPSSGATLLLPGLTIAGNASDSTGPRVFTYDAEANEVLNFTVQAITSKVTFEAKLRDKTSSKDIKTTSTGSKSGIASIVYNATSGPVSLELDVSTSNTTGGLFQVQLVSNVNRTISVCGSSNGTWTNSTVNGTQTGSSATASVLVSSSTSRATPTPTQSGSQTSGSSSAASGAAVAGVTVAKNMAAAIVVPVLMAVAL